MDTAAPAAESKGVDGGHGLFAARGNFTDTPDVEFSDETVRDGVETEPVVSYPCGLDMFFRHGSLKRRLFRSAPGGALRPVAFAESSLTSLPLLKFLHSPLDALFEFVTVNQEFDLLPGIQKPGYFFPVILFQRTHLVVFCQKVAQTSANRIIRSAFILSEAPELLHDLSLFFSDGSLGLFMVSHNGKKLQGLLFGQLQIFSQPIDVKKLDRFPQIAGLFHPPLLPIFISGPVRRLRACREG
jgi:hypothetical protein